MTILRSYNYTTKKREFDKIPAKTIMDLVKICYKPILDSKKIKSSYRHPKHAK